MDKPLTRMWDVVWLSDKITVAEAVVVGTINNVQQAQEESMVSSIHSPGIWQNLL